jgi:hypothetical protein
MLAEERIRLRDLMLRHKASFDQNLKLIDDHTDKEKALYFELLDLIKADMDGANGVKAKHIADLAFLGWQTVQIAWLEKTLEAEQAENS